MKVLQAITLSVLGAVCFMADGLMEALDVAGFAALLAALGTLALVSRAADKKRPRADAGTSTRGCSNAKHHHENKNIIAHTKRNCKG